MSTKTDSAVTPPLVVWAQRKDKVFVTLCLEDCKDPDLQLEETKVFFKGIGGTEKKPHECTIELFKEIDPEKSQKSIRDRNIELILKKKDTNSPYWPTLTKDKKKYHWIKVDFSKWNDENDSEDELGGGFGGNDDLESMMRQMGGLGGMEGEKPSFDELEEEEDSDDEELPALE